MNTKSVDICFQCGKPRIQTKQYTEYVNGSAVVSTESVCSDPDCQKRTMETLEKERIKRNYSITNRQNNVFGAKKLVKS